MTDHRADSEPGVVMTVRAAGHGSASPASKGREVLVKLEGRARGVACSSFLSHSAQVTEISLDDRGRIHIDRIETTEE
jgi:hypothetical protein